MNDLICPHCEKTMQFLTREQLQLGKTGWILGDLPNLLAGALTVNIYMCPKCRKLEFFAAEDQDEASGDDLPQKTCPKCGTVHDFDYPKCPKCGHDYYT